MPSSARLRRRASVPAGSDQPSAKRGVDAPRARRRGARASSARLGHAERDAGLADLALRAHEPLRHRRRARPETPSRSSPRRSRESSAGSAARGRPESIAGCAHANISARRSSGSVAASVAAASSSSAIELQMVDRARHRAALAPASGVDLLAPRHRQQPRLRACAARRSPASRPAPPRTRRRARPRRPRRRACATPATRRACRSSARATASAARATGVSRRPATCAVRPTWARSDALRPRRGSALGQRRRPRERACRDPGRRSRGSRRAAPSASAYGPSTTWVLPSATRTRRRRRDARAGARRST